MSRFLIFAFGLGAILILLFPHQSSLISPLLPPTPIPTPLKQYSYENLRSRQYAGSEIKLEKIIKKEVGYTSWLFSYQTDDKRVTGQLNLPEKKGKLPVIVMLRGYADDQIYFTGLGTRKAAGVFAQDGFITLAPDFLGFGNSDWPSEDILAARFYRPVEVLNLLASIGTLPQTDPQNIFLWGHSNGGQIALSVLEILPAGRQIPTTLWAPVTRGFPESITQYMTELDDQGEKVKKAIDEFLKIYDPQDFSVDNYFKDINTTLQIHQGLTDPLIKEEWTADFVKKLQALGKNVTYYQYPRNDHNLQQSWDLVVSRDLQFFRNNLN